MINCSYIYIIYLLHQQSIVFLKNMDKKTARLYFFTIGLNRIGVIICSLR